MSSQLSSIVNGVFKIFPGEEEDSKYHLFFFGHG